MTTAHTEYRKRFCARTKAIRELANLTQRDMAETLGIDTEAYKKYEQRTPLPHPYVRRFCLITGVTEDTLFDVDKPILRTVRKAKA